MACRAIKLDVSSEILALVCPSPFPVDKHPGGLPCSVGLQFALPAYRWSCFAVRSVAPSMLCLPVIAWRTAGSWTTAQHILSELKERKNPKEHTSDLNRPSRAFVLQPARQVQPGCTREWVVRRIQGFPSRHVRISGWVPAVHLAQDVASVLQTTPDRSQQPKGSLHALAALLRVRARQDTGQPRGVGAAQQSSGSPFAICCECRGRIGHAQCYGSQTLSALSDVSFTCSQRGVGNFPKSLPWARFVSTSSIK